MSQTVAIEPDLTVTQVARELGFHPETVRDMLKSGALPGYKPGQRRWRVRRVDLDSFKQRGRVRAVNQ